VAWTLAGCGVGWQYRYGGQHYTMTRPNIEYHEQVIRDVRTRDGGPSAQDDLAKLIGACELLQPGRPGEHVSTADRCAMNDGHVRLAIACSRTRRCVVPTCEGPLTFRRLAALSLVDRPS